MNNATRTLWFDRLCGILTRGIDYSLVGNTTLNEKFSVLSGQAPASSSKPTLAYFAIGNGGMTYTTASDGTLSTKEKQHAATDAALFNHLPFALRTTDNDLSATDRAKYAIRKLVTINSVQYYAYYLKRLSSDSLSVALEYHTVSNGTDTATTYTPTSTNLSPTAKDLSTSGTNTTSGDYVASTIKQPVTLSAAEITEITDAAEIIYGESGHAIINEIALCTGTDYTTTVASSSGTISFTEAIAVECAVFFNNDVNLTYIDEDFEILLDVGSSGPVYNITT